MVSLLPTKFNEILFSSFRGVALTNCVTDRQTDRQTDRTKTICLPTKVGGDINTLPEGYVARNLCKFMKEVGWSPDRVVMNTNSI
jgi:hypothetical protein